MRPMHALRVAGRLTRHALSDSVPRAIALLRCCAAAPGPCRCGGTPIVRQRNKAGRGGLGASPGPGGRRPPRSHECAAKTARGWTGGAAGGDSGACTLPAWRAPPLRFQQATLDRLGARAGHGRAVRRACRRKVIPISKALEVHSTLLRPPSTPLSPVGFRRTFSDHFDPHIRCKRALSGTSNAARPGEAPRGHRQPGTLARCGSLTQICSRLRQRRAGGTPEGVFGEAGARPATPPDAAPLGHRSSQVGHQVLWPCRRARAVAMASEGAEPSPRQEPEDAPRLG